MKEIATLAGGCFWCLEAVFQQLRGVDSVVSGYMGGHLDHPTYHQICDGDTGHAEVVQINFDPNIISYATLLDVFFTLHDPTTLNRQGNDIGTQYRSAIFYHSAEQEAAALAARIKQTEFWPSPLQTDITIVTTFWPAEDYHQDYFRQHAGQTYCALVVAPKINKVAHRFAALFLE